MIRGLKSSLRSMRVEHMGMASWTLRSRLMASKRCRRVASDGIRPGKPTDNCFIESSNGRFRDECLDANLFTNLAEARNIIEEWRQDYNVLRPHSSLGRMSPDEYRRAPKGRT